MYAFNEPDRYPNKTSYCLAARYPAGGFSRNRFSDYLYTTLIIPRLGSQVQYEREREKP